MALDLAFDAATLHDLRTAVQAHAIAAGMPGDRAAQVMLAVHELAANAVCHGGGSGRAQMSIVGGQLHCQVSDGGQRVAEATDAVVAWPFRQGHGLWLVRNLADVVSVAHGLAGSQVIAVFSLPGFGPDATGQLT